MTQKQALKIAKQIAGDAASVSMHRGATRTDRAIKIHGCYPETATRIGREIETALAVDGLRAAAGFVAVWF